MPRGPDRCPPWREKSQTKECSKWLQETTCLQCWSWWWWYWWWWWWLWWWRLWCWWRWWTWGQEHVAADAEPHVRNIKILSPHYLRHKSFGPSSNLPRNDHRDMKTFHSIEEIMKSQIDGQVMKTFHFTWSRGYEIVSDHLRLRKSYTEPWCLKHKQDSSNKSWRQIIWVGKP